ncbi:MAG: apolipoprotein N-acyltransferase, partial [Elusimicrobia bacterium]|nr:apolipoprotein N-acyltransferase [Elusimicrobiota bacterium]
PLNPGPSLPYLSAVLLILCFPKPDLGWLAWIALFPLLKFLLQSGTRERAFRAAYIAGVIFYTGLLYWIYVTCRAGGVSPIFSLLAWLLLSLILAVNWSVFGIAVFHSRILLGFTEKKTLRWIKFPVVLGLPFLLACVWTSLEFIQARFLWQFPWELLGYSQWRHPALLQVASWTGVYGISFLIVWVNATLAVAHVSVPVLQGNRGALLILPGLALGLNTILGSLCLYKSSVPSSLDKISVALLQPNVDQYKKWTPSFTKEIQSSLTQLSLQAEQNGADLIVWPESSVPGFFEDPVYHGWLSHLVQRGKAIHVIGAVTQLQGGIQNAAFLFSPPAKQGVIIFVAKRHLVPFGEFIPLKAVLARWIPVLNAFGEIMPGTSPGILDSPVGKLGMTICYESIFPHLTRELVARGAHVLINMTNDGWYLNTAGPYQHFSMNVLRAVENRRFLLRSANTGISAVVDPYGRILSQTHLGEKAVLVTSLPSWENPERSFYSRFGDWFGWLCLGVSLLSLGSVTKLLTYLEAKV